MWGEDDGAEEGGDAVVVPPLDLWGEVNGVGEEAAEGGEDVDAHDAAEGEGEEDVGAKAVLNAGEVLKKKCEDGDKGESGPEDAAGEGGAGWEVGDAGDLCDERVPEEVEVGGLWDGLDGEEGIGGVGGGAKEIGDEGDANGPVGDMDAFKEGVAELEAGGDRNERLMTYGEPYT